MTLEMTMREAVVFFLPRLDGRYFATIKEVKDYFKEDEKYLKNKNPYALDLDIEATFRTLVDENVIKNLTSSEMNDEQRCIADKEKEGIYSFVNPDQGA